MLKIYENERNDNLESIDIDYSKYRRLINKIASDITSGANANLSKNLKKIFNEYGGDAHIVKVSPRFISYDGYVFCDTRNGRSMLSGSVSLGNLRQDINRLAEDIAYVQYLNHGGKDVGMTLFLYYI